MKLTLATLPHTWVERLPMGFNTVFIVNGVYCLVYGRFPDNCRLTVGKEESPYLVM